MYLTKVIFMLKTLGKITSLYKLGDVAACCAERTVQSDSHSALYTTHMPLYDMLPHADDLLCLQLHTVGSPYTVHAANLC